MSDRANNRKRKPDPYDFPTFQGYHGPRFTPVPDEFLDHQLADLSSAETKVLLYLFRKTYGYRKSADRISLSQLERGTRSSDGTIIDRGTGLSKVTILRAIKGLQEKGLVTVRRSTTNAGDSDINHYHIREFTGHPPDERSGGSQRGGEDGPDSGPHAPDRGSFTSDTTPVSKLNHPRSGSEPRGSIRNEPTRPDVTREDSTREDFTLTLGVDELTRSFLEAIGYSKPAKAKRERTSRILNELTAVDGYSLAEVEAACEIAASMGARGPELVPHVIGQAPPEPTAAREVGERLAHEREEEQCRWTELSKRFDALPLKDQSALMDAARASNRILAKRPSDHPLVRAAAISLLEPPE